MRTQTTIVSFCSMMYKSISVLFLLVIVVESFIFKDVYPNKSFDKPIKDAGDPLFLTPLIEENRIDEARQLALVPPELFLNTTSYSGFFTVDKTFNSNLFFWFFPAQEDYKNAPVLLWLQGGPGATSLIALFQENGPFFLKSATDLTPNPFSWTKSHSVIYIDNPVQTGFSFTNGGFAQNETKVGEDLHQALTQFFTIFTELQSNDFFITGESYAGKYVPAASYAIYKKNQDPNNLKINLKGMSIGNGLCDPEHQLMYSSYLYEIGLLDSNGRQQFLEIEQQGIGYIKNKQFYEAFRIFDDLLNGNLNGGNTSFKNLTGFNYYFNYLYVNNPSNSDNYLFEFVTQENIRKAIHVGNLTFNGGVEVKKNLVTDVMDSVAPWIAELLNNNIRVLFYNGQLDIIVPYPLTVNFLENLNFNSANKYKTAQRHIWKLRNDIAGYVKEAGNLTEVLVRNAGHMVPNDQPQAALHLITEFTRNQPIYSTV